MKKIVIYLFTWTVLFSCHKNEEPVTREKETNPNTSPALAAVNEKEIPAGKKIRALVGAMLIDGKGGEPISDACVLIDGNTISDVGKNGDIPIPPEADIVDVKGLYLLPGLIDAHFHLDGSKELPYHFLQHGVTSLRDPGAWIEAYAGERASGYALPRLFLTGPHLDMPPPAYPLNALLVRDVEEARLQVNRMADQGASAIKIYFRVSLQLIREICAVAHQRGLPVTAHLEIVKAKDAILAGVDGIEHVTSFGTDLIPEPEAEKYRQAVLADNNARREGRYAVWNTIDVNAAETDSLINFLVDQQTFLCPTLGAFEYRMEKGKEDSVKVNGFKNMMSFVGKAQEAGVSVVVGSHSIVPYAPWGWSFHHEMELLVESGMSPAEVIVAATMENARFFRIADRLGSIEKGKQADLILLKANPLNDMSAMRQIHSVMLNGVWVSDTIAMEP